MDWDDLLSPMGNAIKGNTKRIKNMEKEYFIGQMAENTMEHGKMESKMGLVNSRQLIVQCLLGNGSKESEYVGF